MNRFLLSAAMVALAAVPVRAELLGVTPGFPLTTFDNQGITTYNSGAELFAVDATPIAIRFSASQPPRFVTADPNGDVFLFLSAKVDSTGTFVGSGPSGSSFEVRGSVDADGNGTPEYVGVLLSGQVREFGFAMPVTSAGASPDTSPEYIVQKVQGALHAGELSDALDLVSESDSTSAALVTAQYDFRLTPTGGALLSFFQGQDIGLRLSSESSNFAGFLTDFIGGAKGSFGPIVTNRTGSCCLTSGVCTDATEAECAALQGEFNGVGSDCASLEKYVFVKNYAALPQDPSAGRVTIVSAMFNPVTKRLTWEIRFTPTGNVLPNAFTLAINNGPNPNGLPGQLALFYFDASGTGPISDPVLTVYGYNGQNNPNSFKDGDGNSANDPNPDKIISSLADDSWVNSLTKRDNGDGSLTLGFDIDATVICEHVPLFPSPGGDPWTGAQFDELLGFWLHPFRVTNADYDAAGCLTAFGFDRQGWVDVSNEHTRLEGCAPATGACCLPSGECRSETEAECIRLNGMYAGDEVPCSALDTYIHSMNYKDASQNAIAGRVTDVFASYSPSTKRLVWQATFKPESGVLPNAFTQVINNGPNPNGLPGQLAIFYLDARSANPVLTVYGYHGKNNFNSFKDGDGISSNDFNPDRILSSSLDSSWVNSLTKRTNADGTLTLGFDINATIINSHVPRFPSAGKPWTGAQFAGRIGFWLHPFKLNSAAYVAGFLSEWKPSKEGWLDVSEKEARLERCPRMADLVCHYDFDEQSGDWVHDRIGDVDLKIMRENGDIQWVNGNNGTGVKFVQNASGRSRIRTNAISDSDPLRNRLMETDAVTVQVFFKQQGEIDLYSRIFSWSKSPEVVDRNFAIIAYPDGISDSRKARVRLRTTSGTCDEEKSNAWSIGQPTVVAFTYDANTDSTMRVYVNGVLVKSQADPHGGFDTWSQYHLMLGNEFTKDRPFKGVIFDVKVWDGALSGDEVAAEANAVRQ